MQNNVKYSIILIIMILGTGIIYSFIPKFKTGYLSGFEDLKNQFGLRETFDFKVENEMFYIERKIFTQWTIIIFGKISTSSYNNDILTNHKSVYSSLFSIDNKIRSRIPDNVWKILNIKKQNINNSNYDYAFIDQTGNPCVHYIKQGLVSNRDYALIYQPQYGYFYLSIVLRR